LDVNCFEYADEESVGAIGLNFKFGFWMAAFRRKIQVRRAT
jgi:hypothetical protein